MEKIFVNTSDSLSEITVCSAWRKSLPSMPEDNTIIITDSNVRKIYGHEFPDYPVIEIEPGERSKSLKEVERLGQQLLYKDIGRTGLILAIGGGVVCDLAGFLASVYMRGIGCGYVSTSLLSQVDASTGGKTGVNLGDIKNVIGSFRQPEFVICDTTMLQTLPEDEYLSGLAELAKTGFIGDSEIINILEENKKEVMSRDSVLLSALVTRAIKYKASVVGQDEKESGLRRLLNFGHTFGHALELHESMKHGFAVASGMELAALFSYSKGFISKEEAGRVRKLLGQYELLKKYNLPSETMEELIIHDKKRAGKDIYFVFLRKTGEGVVKKIPLREAIDFYRSHKK